MHLHHLRSREILAEHESVLYRVLDGERLEPEHIDRACLLLDDMLTRRAAVGMLLIMEHGTPLPSTDTIKYIRARFDPYGERVVVSVVVLGLGFWLTTALRLFGYFQSLAPSDGHTVVPATTIDRGAQALAAELVGVDPSALVRHCADLRGRLRVHQQGLR